MIRNNSVSKNLFLFYFVNVFVVFFLKESNNKFTYALSAMFKCLQYHIRLHKFHAPLETSTYQHEIPES